MFEGLFQPTHLILIIAMIVFGPGKLPEIGAGLGRSIREFKKATDVATKDFRESFEEPKSLTTPVAGTRACPRCSSLNGETSRFCNQCGADLTMSLKS